ncbi:hypothetical protein EDC04DRAFT_2610987 [Pisolithus marmoratus]|nr:hypothetical protein EDC04DRAFT_2610987 [Pisolithus marmoratus]
MSQQQWLFRQSSPIVRDGVTCVITSHIPTVAAVQRDMTPLILQHFAPPVPSISHANFNPEQTLRITVSIYPLVIQKVKHRYRSVVLVRRVNPQAGHAPLITVSPQKLNKFRDTTGSFHWFRLEGDDPLSFPPSHIEDVAEGDLFFYWVKSARQMSNVDLEEY